ncbi:hypothetical protein O9992_30595 [Vibrio lentus]|nr:hypothetical protein [Vibrio lentus]
MTLKSLGLPWSINGERQEIARVTARPLTKNAGLWGYTATGTRSGRLFGSRSPPSLNGAEVHHAAVDTAIAPAPPPPQHQHHLCYKQRIYRLAFFYVLFFVLFRTRDKETKLATSAASILLLTWYAVPARTEAHPRTGIKRP